MKRASNRIETFPFSPDRLIEEVNLLRGCERRAEPTRQMRYLADFAQGLKAQTVVVEHRYIDRHYTEEFVTYYSRLLDPPPTSCARVHFFAEKFDDDYLNKLLAVAHRTPLSDEDRAAHQKFSVTYLGYVVIRPIPSIPIGRTILKPWEDDDSRAFPVKSRSQVHLLGLHLEVDGLAFQQQDRAVSSCATAALWSAMTQAARLDGGRAPTPAALAESAGRHFLEDGRSLPTRGLTITQLSGAIRDHGFAPELLRVTERPELFVVSMFTYLRSKIPVVLILEDAEGAHAVTAVGHRLGDRQPDLSCESRVMSERIERLYVHDDRIGPYARASLRVVHGDPAENASSDALLFLEIEPKEGPFLVRLGFIPAYPKLRLPASTLLALSARYVAMVEECAGDDAIRLEADLFFQKAGDVLADICGPSFPEGRLADFLRSVSLSRWVGIARWRLGSERFCDLLFDTTDVPREDDSTPLLIGAVAYSERIRAALVEVGKAAHIPVL